LYETIFRVTGTAMISFGEDEVIRLANEEWASLTGWSASEVVGAKTWPEFFTEASRVKMRQYQALRSEGAATLPHTYETQLVDRQGTVHDGIVTIALVPGTAQRIASFLDTTELKQTQQQMYRAEKMAALGHIVAGVAHEINNPNNFIHFNLPILRQYIDAIRPHLDDAAKQDPDLRILNMAYGEFVDDVYKLLDNMQHGSTRISEIVGELRNYTKSHESKGKTPESMNAVVHRAMTLVGKQIRKKVKRFETAIDESLPPVMMNAGRIEQVLINLLINASHAVGKEDSWVRLSAGVSAEDPQRIEIAIEDNGIGIAQEDLELIFDPFFTRKTGSATGTGLGLAITQTIIADHGGEIVVRSSKGEGTCFTIHLPIIQVGTS
jgi:PAS domain S-box-containing protein